MVWEGDRKNKREELCAGVGKGIRIEREECDGVGKGMGRG